MTSHQIKMLLPDFYLRFDIFLHQHRHDPIMMLLECLIPMFDSLKFLERVSIHFLSAYRVSKWYSAAMPRGHGEEQALPRPLYSESGHLQGTESKKTYCARASNTSREPRLHKDSQTVLVGLVGFHLFKFSAIQLIDLISNRFWMVEDQTGTAKRCHVNICKHM